MMIGGISVFNYVMKNDNIRQGIIKDMSSKIDNFLFGEKKANEDDWIIFNNRFDAEEILNQLQTIIDNYGYVTVVDFKDLVGIPSSYIDTKLGWTTIKNAEIIRSTRGYAIKLPSSISLA